MPELAGDLRFIDSTQVKVHQDGCNPAGGQQDQDMGKTKGGLNTKIHAAVDSRERQAGLDVLASQFGEIRENFVNCQVRGQVLQDVIYGKSPAADARLSTALAGLNGDDVLVIRAPMVSAFARLFNLPAHSEECPCHAPSGVGTALIWLAANGNPREENAVTGDGSRSQLGFPAYRPKN